MIYDLTKTFPVNECYGLVAQLQRAAVSITSNIAEGFRRRTQKDKRNFYRTSLASLTEVENQLIISRDIQYVLEPAFQKTQAQIIIVGRLINGLLKSAMTL